jgi:hypothetical protein
MAKKLPPMHPGEVLREEFLKPLDMAPGRLAKACGLPRTRIERIASVPIPKFASFRCTFVCELRNRDTSKLLI